MDKIGSYQILEVMRRGPQSVFRVKAADGRVLVLKAAPVKDSTEETRARFLREGETCRGLNHPHLVRVLDAGEADGHLYQAMEALEGDDLERAMAAGRAFSWEEKLGIMQQICDGLAHAHDQRLVHRDIKPANLFLEDSGRAVVLDFGMVRVAESELTKAGAAVGTVNYMAPEQIRGERCTAASDVFSAGIVFYQLATGRHPFTSKDRSLAQVVSAIIFEPPPKLSSICPEAPEGLEFLLNRALHKDPAKRFQNAGELGQAIAVCQAAMTSGVRVGAASSGPTVVMDAPAADDEKTRVFDRPRATAAGPRVVSTPAPASAVAAPASPAAAPGLRFRYCPACTSANPPDATVCSRCGVPLGQGGTAAAQSKNWGMIIAIAVAGTLAIVLVIVVMAKR
jgi:serine/threonine protein kinase